VTNTLFENKVIKDDFEFFVNYIQDYKPIIRNKIEKLGNLIYEQLNELIRISLLISSLYSLKVDIIT